MAQTNTYSGALTILAQGKNTLGGDTSGEQKGTVNKSITFSASGGSAPTISGFFSATATLNGSAANLLLAHATNPFTNLNAGTVTYSDGFTVASSKLKLLIFENLDNSIAITIGTPSANRFELIQANSQSLRALAAGDIFMFYMKAGSAALTTGSNDAIALTPASGSPTLQVSAFYGP